MLLKKENSCVTMIAFIRRSKDKTWFRGQTIITTNSEHPNTILGYY